MENNSAVPAVSIIMGVYNGAQYLAKSVDSIIWQTYSNWELIICDDASTDNTMNILSDYKDPRIIIIRNEKNRGLGFCLNKCIEKARGKYLMRQDSDDFSFFDLLKKQVYYMDNHPEIDILGSNALMVDEDDHVWGIHKMPTEMNVLQWFKEVQVLHPTVIMKKNLVETMGGYDPEAIRLEDYELWMRLLGKNVVFRNIPDTLYYYRLTLADYKKKKINHRLREIRFRYFWAKQFKFPPITFLYLAKSLFVLLIPRYLLYLYHRNKFSLKYLAPV